MRAQLESVGKTNFGALRVTAAAVGPTSDVKAGIALLNGALHIIELGAGAVPDTREMVCGFAFSNGALYTTQTPPTASAVVSEGIVARSDGALHAILDSDLGGSIYFYEHFSGLAAIGDGRLVISLA